MKESTKSEKIALGNVDKQILKTEILEDIKIKEGPNSGSRGGIMFTIPFDSKPSYKS
jgi:hypothetical protein